MDSMADDSRRYQSHLFRLCIPMRGIVASRYTSATVAKAGRAAIRGSVVRECASTTIQVPWPCTR
eukprot:101510-Pyramimonas_sp.AAC.1